MNNNNIGIIYIGHDNTVDLQLSYIPYNQNAAIIIDHTILIKVEVKIGNVAINSISMPSAFDLTHADRMILKFGQLNLLSGKYLAELIAYDNQNVNGVVWGFFDLVIT